MIESFDIHERFRGPPRSGNGGYVCGRMAQSLSGDVVARLKAPPPLGVTLSLETHGDQARLSHGELQIGEARVAPLDFLAPPPPSYEQARAASPAYIGFHDHAFPGCFVCGPERAPHDGLRIFPGSVDGGSTIAAPWIPDASLAHDTGTVKREFLWAALDCTGGIAVMPPPEGSAVVLGELHASITGTVSANEPCVVVGWPLAFEGRKRRAASAVYGADGRPIAVARAVWVVVPLSTWA